MGFPIEAIAVIYQNIEDQNNQKKEETFPPQPPINKNDGHRYKKERNDNTSLVRIFALLHHLLGDL